MSLKVIFSSILSLLFGEHAIYRGVPISQIQSCESERETGLDLNLKHLIPVFICIKYIAYYHLAMRVVQ